MSCIDCTHHEPGWCHIHDVPTGEQATCEEEMMAVKHYDDFGVDVCEALGLGAHKVTWLSLNLEANSVPTVVATMYLDDSEVEALTEVLRRYKVELRPIEDDDDPKPDDQ